MLSTDLLPRPTPAPAPSVQSRTKIRTFVRLSTSTPALPVCVSGSSSQCRSRAGLGANELPKSAATSALHRGAHTCTAAVLPHRAVTGTEAFVQSPACTGRGRCVWVRAGGGDWGDGEGQGGGEGGGEMFHGFELKLKDSSWLREGPGASKSKGAGSPSKAGGGGSRKANAKKSNVRNAPFFSSTALAAAKENQHLIECCICSKYDISHVGHIVRGGRCCVACYCFPPMCFPYVTRPVSPVLPLPVVHCRPWGHWALDCLLHPVKCPLSILFLASLSVLICVSVHGRLRNLLGPQGG